MLGGRSELEDFALRVTSIYRRENGQWRIVLRHADPIVVPRPPDARNWPHLPEGADDVGIPTASSAEESIGLYVPFRAQQPREQCTGSMGGGSSTTDREPYRTGGDADHAEARRRELVADYGVDLSVLHASGVTVGELLTRWFAAGHAWKPSTRIGYDCDVRAL